MLSVMWRGCAFGLLGLVIAGCGGGGGSSGDTPAPATTLDLTVVVIDPASASGYAHGATLCLDEDADLQCQAGELSASTDAVGQAHFTLDAAAQTRLTRGRLIALVNTTVTDASTGEPISTQVVQLAAPYTAPSARVVISPLTTWAEQLVLATLPRAQALAAVGEQAELQSLAVNSDFIAAAGGATDAERQRARTKATAMLTNQTADVMQVLRAPAKAYADTLFDLGTWRVGARVSDAGPQAFSGSLSVAQVMTVDPTPDPQWVSALLSYDAAVGYALPADVMLIDTPAPGPLLNADGTWLAAPVTARRERVGGQVVLSVGGIRREVEMRSARVLDGQLIDAALLPNVTLPVPTRFPAGSLRFQTLVHLSLSSYIGTDLPIQLCVGGACVNAANFDGFRSFYRVDNNQWFDLGINGYQMAFGADGQPRFRSYDGFDPPQDEGSSVVESYAFLGQNIIRVPLPSALVSSFRYELSFVEREGVLRRADVHRRGELTTLSQSRFVNPTAARAMLGALGWPEPPGGL